MNVKKIKNIGILGLAYKEGTNSIKNSPAVRFLKKIKATRYKIYLYDPLVKKIHGNSNWNFCEKETDVLNKCELILFGTSWKSLTKIKINIYKNLKTVIDPYGIFKNLRTKNLNILVWDHR